MRGASLKAGFERAGIVYVSGGTRAWRLTGCARRKSRGACQQFASNENGPGGAIFVRWLFCKPAFARREPTKIAARQRRAMSSVGG